MNRYSSVWVAVLGIAVGAMAAVAVQKFNENRAKIRTEYTDWGKLNLVLRTIDRNYVDTIDRKAVSDAAISAALSALDPHSIYMPPVILEETESELAGNFDGIGIQFNVPNDTAIVLEVIPGGPSEKIGLQAGDRIIKVDDKVIAGVRFPQDSMVHRMKGPAGSKVLITVRRGKETVPFEITRGKIPVNSVDAAFMVNDTTGYLRLSKFARTTYSEVVKRCKDLLAEGMKYLIFDVRDNSGGFFDQSLLLSDMFLRKNSDIVYLEGLHRKREGYTASGKGLLQDVKLAVLIDESSASSSEIFAGAIQDNDRGLIIGRRSFGKGLVQEPVYFSDGSGIRITVARYYTPSGRCIQKPYASDEEYQNDIWERYVGGEMLDADSIKVDTTQAYKTLAGRIVYGGGGIVPDVFVPMDTTHVSKFYQACSRKATPMRFASAWFDAHKAEIQRIGDFKELERYLNGSGLEQAFLLFAASKDGLRPSSEREWQLERNYMMTSVRALVGRYSLLGDDAFYHLYLGTDKVVEAALAN